jgi:hypothetical protein
MADPIDDQMKVQLKPGQFGPAIPMPVIAPEDDLARLAQRDRIYAQPAEPEMMRIIRSYRGLSKRGPATIDR